MIKTAAEMLKALKRGTWCGVVLFEGASLLDGGPIVVIANRITSASHNAKTGAMIQSYILRADIDPREALRQRLDASICGDCIHRPDEGGKRTCYVNIGRGPMSTFDAFQRGRYARPGVDYDVAIIPELFAGLLFRAGTYGDPTAAPYQVWRRATLKAKAITGYVHQWRQPRFAPFKTLCMASADSVADADEANAAGWRSFRVRKPSEYLRPKEVICPASAEAGRKVQCDVCKACGGTSAKAKASIAILAHGIGARIFNGRVSA